MYQLCLLVAECGNHTVLLPCNRLQLVHKAKAVHLLMSTEERTVLLLVLQDAYQSAQVVLKGYSAAHAALCKEQVCLMFPA